MTGWSGRPWPRPRRAGGGAVADRSRGDDGASRLGGEGDAGAVRRRPASRPGDPLTGPGTEALITAPRVVTAEAGRPVLEPGYVTVAAGRVTAVAPGRPPRAPA